MRFNPREQWPWYAGLVIPVLLLIALVLPEGKGLPGRQTLPGVSLTGDSRTVTLTDISANPTLLQQSQQAITQRLRSIGIESSVALVDHGLKITVPTGVTNTELRTLIAPGNRSIRVVFGVRAPGARTVQVNDSSLKSPPGSLLRLVSSTDCPALGFYFQGAEDDAWTAACAADGTRYVLGPALAGDSGILGGSAEQVGTAAKMALKLDSTAVTAVGKASGMLALVIDGVVYAVEGASPGVVSLALSSVLPQRTLVLAAAIINGGEHELNFGAQLN